MESRLQLICVTPAKAKVCIDIDVETPLYRYFTSEVAVSNSKETWVPGVNQNRYFNEDPDPNEYYEQRNTILGREGLSFTTNPPEIWKKLYPNKYRYWIKIDDVNCYAKTLLNDCLSNDHIISWLDKDELLRKAQYANQISALEMIPADPSLHYDLTLLFHGLYIRKPVYDGSAYGKDEKFKDQCETRVEFACDPGFKSDCSTPEPTLHKLVEYYKLNTPNTSKFYSATGEI